MRLVIVIVDLLVLLGTVFIISTLIDEAQATEAYRVFIWFGILAVVRLYAYLHRLLWQFWAVWSTPVPE